MTKRRRLLQLSAAVCAALLFAVSSRAQELILNGTFERAGLFSWELSAPAGTSIAPANESSPFELRYPKGTAAVRLQDDFSDPENPRLSQNFAPTRGVLFSFDFKAPSLAPGSPWYVAWRGDEEPATAFFFAIGGADGTSLDFNQNPVTTLLPNVWYHVEGWADAPSQVVDGFVVNERGERATFQGGFPFGVQSVLNGFFMGDGDADRNDPILLDNVSSRLPTLSIARGTQGQVTVTWAAPGFTLQGSATLNSAAQWIDIPTSQQTYTTQANQPLQFFRLVRR